MSKIVVLFHSGYGHTQRVAEAVAQGAGAELLPISAEGELPEGGWDKLAAAGAIILGSPTYMGGPSWQFKRMADASSKVWAAGGWRDKLFAGFTNSATMNGDKHATLDYLYHLSMQHGGLWVGNGVVPSNTKAAGRGDPNYVGGFAGVMVTSPADASPAEMVQGDLDTAKALGARVASTLQRLGQP